MPSPKLDLRGVCPGCGQTVDVTGARTWATHSAVADQSSTAKRYRRCAWSSQKLGAAEMRASLTAAHEGAVRAAATRLREAEAARDAHVAADRDIDPAALRIADDRGAGIRLERVGEAEVRLDRLDLPVLVAQIGRAHV